MRMLIATLLIFLGVPQGAPPVPNGAIEGRVIRISNSEPISGVQMTLVPTAPQQPAGAPPPAPGPTIQLLRTPDGGAQMIQTNPNGTQTVTAISAANVAAGNIPLPNLGPAVPPITTLTDSDGKFVFPNLAPGTYTVRAQRLGYFGPMGPQGTYPGGVGKSVTVESTVTAKTEIGMVQGGVIRGLVRDPDGQPAPNYAVVTARPAYTNLGRAIWQLTGAMNADDRGEYRWPNYAPGEYYIGVGPRAPGPIANAQDAWARVFYPGVIDPNQARPITIREGEEVIVNLAAQLKPWGAYKISGVAINPLPNLPADPVTGVVNRGATALVLMPYDLTPLDNPPTTMWTNLVATNTKPNGEFVLSNVDPGRYELYAMATDIQNRRVWTGHMRIEVKDKDITGLNISVSPGVTLRGEVAITGGATVTPGSIRLSLQALGTLPPQVAMTVGQIPIDESGKFQIANLAEGRYRLNVNALPAGAYVSNVQLGGTNVFDDGFEVDAQTSQLPLRVEVNPAGETIEGNVRNQQKDVAGAMVVLVPTAHRNNPAYYKTSITDDKGRFSIRGVAPGSYTALAWEAVMPGAYQNAEFLGKYQTRGRTLTVQAGSRSDLQLELIRGN